MFQGGAPVAVLGVLLTVFVASLPTRIAGAKPAQVTCRSFGPRFCEFGCRFDQVTEICCRCFGTCCPAEDGGQKVGDDDPEEDAVDAGDTEDADDSEKPTTQESEKRPTGGQPPERLILQPKSFGFLPPGYQPVSALTTTAPTLAPTTCVESGYPGDVHEDGSLWLSLARPCKVLKCFAGVTKVIVDNCAYTLGTTTTPPPPPPAQTTAAATAAPTAHSSGHYYPCTDPNTGVSHHHGTTWKGGSVHCAIFRCMNGTVHLAGFCSSPVPESDLPDPELPDQESPAPEPTVSVVPVTPTSVPPPTLAPRPSSPDGDAEQTGSSCVDDYGQVQASGNVWTVPARPCLRYRCQDGIIYSLTTPCAPIPPSCTSLPALPGQCCPSYTCPQGPLDCTFGGRTYRSGDVFDDDTLHPCQQLKCDDGLVVELSPPTVCIAVYCAEPDWLGGDCCKTCPVEDLPDGLEELKQLVLRMGQRVNLPVELVTRLEENVDQLVAQLAALMRDSDAAVTLKTLLNNLIEMTDILTALETGVVDSSVTEIEVLLVQLRVRLFALVELLTPTLTNDQINNANIDIGELIAWLRAFLTAGRASAANILMNDLIRLFSGLLMEPGCTDAVGTVHAVDTLYVDDPGSPQLCYVCANLSSGVSPLAVMNVSDCGGPPPPGCTARLVPNSCCPRLHCAPGEAACRDDLGQLHPHGSIYVDDPKHPCVTYNCSNGLATITDTISCMAISPGCTPWRMVGFCCPKSDCPEIECVYEGRTRDHGTTWPREPLRPCEILTCLNGQVTSEDIGRYCPAPPADHCVARQVSYRCCPEYDCVTVNCTYNGQVYREGETWPDDPQYPCKRYNCTRQGTEKVQDLSERCKGRPYASCTGQRVAGDCCKEWTCPECQYGGRSYPEGSVFWDSPVRRCAQLVCRAGETVQLSAQTVCPPVPDGCTPNYSGTSCCHVKYTCPSCMFDPQGNFLRMIDGVGVFGSP